MGNSSSYATLEEWLRTTCSYRQIGLQGDINVSVVANATDLHGLVGNSTLFTLPPTTGATPVVTFNASVQEKISDILHTKVIVFICILGFIGNILNLAILIPKGLNYSLGRIEKFAYSGLIGLALSDMTFCLLIIPYGFLDMSETAFDKMTFQVVYDTYGHALINMTVLCSTWLTVALALGRYLAVCHPLRAREIIGMTFAKRSLFIVVTCCVLFNLPRFWEFFVAQVPHCTGSKLMYFKYEGYMKFNQTAATIYTWAYLLFGILLPFIVLIFCNWYLICALQKSKITRTKIRAPTNDVVEPNSNLTLMLVVVVVMYIALVSPAELMNCMRYLYLDNTDTLNLLCACANTLQALNFSINFTVYYAINASFRKAFINLVTCHCRRLGVRGLNRHFSTNTSSTSMTTRSRYHRSTKLESTYDAERISLKFTGLPA